jgi:tetratricopeptide (TPR) repeat protein
LLACGAGQAVAQDKGWEDLDQATQLKLQAKSMADLERVVELCELALQKGLDEQNELLAKSLLTSTLYQHASRFAQAIVDPEQRNRQWQVLRQFAMRDLDKALRYDQDLADVHLLAARLEALPEGNREKARQSAARAVELFTQQDDTENLAKALLVRGGLTEDPEQRLADYDRAVELNPRDLDAWRARARFHAARGDTEQAVDDFMRLLERNPDDIAAHQMVAGLLATLRKFDEAGHHLQRLIDLNPDSPLPYRLRAGVHIAQEKWDEALADIDRALEVEPTDFMALLIRSEIHQQRGDSEAARRDVDRALELKPDLPQAVLQRAEVAIDEQRYADAIRDIQLVLRAVDDIGLKTRLAILYTLNDQPRRAIRVYGQILADISERVELLRAQLELADDDEQRDRLKTELELLQQDYRVASLRGRGDAYLSVGKQGEAIADYEQALEVEPDESGVLNNLAWVLATSPDDQLRDGKRALELARKACEVTDYEQAHVLSTLAAAHAELRDFENAIQWSSKAVELDQGQIEQLAQELESYREKKPWRERQVIEENEGPTPEDQDLEVAPDTEDSPAAESDDAEDDLPADPRRQDDAPQATDPEDSERPEGVGSGAGAER